MKNFYNAKVHGTYFLEWCVEKLRIGTYCQRIYVKGTSFVCLVMYVYVTYETEQGVFLIAVGK